jgi:hypothetical protein
VKTETCHTLAQWRTGEVPIVRQTCGTKKNDDAKLRSLIPRYHYADQVKANEMGGACGTHERGEKIVQSFGGKARRKETTGKTKA